VTADAAALAERVRLARQQVDRETGRAQQVRADAAAVNAEIARLEAAAELHAKVALLLTTISERKQEDDRARFEGAVTRALQIIFGPELSFGLVPGETGGQPTLEPVIRSDYGGTITETSVLDARGGGMAAVAGFMMRLVMLLFTPGARQVLFLDESFAHVSESYADRVAAFLREAAYQAGVQIVLSAHSVTYAQYADQLIRLTLGPDGLTRVFEGESELCRASLRRTRVVVHFVSAVTPNITTRHAAGGAQTGSDGTTRLREPPPS
jgi:hypothetical protein